MSEELNRDALEEIYVEYKKAEKKFKPFNSQHEGYAVIKEELDELWEEVKKWPEGGKQRLRKEAIQIGAMALRFIIDICNKQ